ncbi:MAG TPA: four helix bundle protein [Gemmatimonadaceae bacterium]|jgi:four helix bundle protein|nr:four helix bundle protein [Gemmatimonadaceae bacterium]
MPLRSYRDLEVWQRAMELLQQCEPIAQRVPWYERNHLASQLRRASLSVPSNIAEGYGRLHRGDYLRHLGYAQSSLKEVETILDGSDIRGYATEEQLRLPRELCTRTGQMLTRLIESLSR